MGKSIEETRLYHIRYLRAINNPLRRKILRALKEGISTVEDLQSCTALERDNLKWHLSVLERGFCVEKDNVNGKILYKLTKEGVVVDRLE